MSNSARWYQDAIIYQTHIKAFYDSAADGIGDLRGLTQKLDYLADLGVTAVWLLPFYPSPLKDDGYDIADYTRIHPSYGTLRDFRTFMREARRHGLRVITELVLNHTSDQHPWFQRARRSPPGSTYRDFYVWSDTQDRYKEARIIFQDFEVSNWTWDPVAGAYFWHRFYSHQPDLNFENPAVHEALLGVVDFWFEMGVDGMRLDAVPYLYEREGTNCENLPETHAFLRKLRHHVDSRFEDRMLLGEANQWPEDAVAYFGDGDECHMAFHFPVMPRMFMAIRMEDRFPVIDILHQTPPIPAGAQWAMFLRNHDELTLEMVTDEERDYMYRVYASDPQARVNLGIRRRLAPLLHGDRQTIQLMNGLLFSLPGTPVVYYGDEIGMGDNIYLGDRDGVRTPMQWSADRNAGFSKANPQQLYLPVVIDPDYHPGAVNVETQQNNPNSLLWWMKRLVALRKRYLAFGRGSIEFLLPDNRKVLVYTRTCEDETILVVANLSRFVQYVELDLSGHRGKVPTELFGGTEFPPIGDLPYFLTLGPHAFYWFSLEPARAEAAVRTAVPTVDADRILEPDGEAALRDVLPAWMASARWFGGKARTIKTVEIIDRITVPDGGGTAGQLVLLKVEYTDGDPETYAVPLAVAHGQRAQDLRDYHGGAVIANLSGTDGVLVDGISEEPFRRALMELWVKRRRLTGARGRVSAQATQTFRRAGGGDGLTSDILGAEQSNTSVLYGDRFVLKLVRRVEPGVNPDLEIGSFLTERARFPHVPPVAGALEYEDGSQTRTLGILQRYVPNEGDAWAFTLDALSTYYETVMTLPADAREASHVPSGHVVELARKHRPISPELTEMIGPYLGAARLLGTRTAELHIALASDKTDPDFAPEPFSALYQRSLYQSMRTLVARVFSLLRGRGSDLPEAVQILDLESELYDRLRALVGGTFDGVRMRVHGDYHLGQVLWTGKDFVLIDFEGEPARPLSERRIKRSPLRDVAGMLRSFHYASLTPLYGGGRPAEDPTVLTTWSRAWYSAVSSAYLGSYLDTIGPTGLVPSAPGPLRIMLDAYVIEKAVYEVGYEANNRPDWLKIPVQGLLQLLEGE